MPTKNEFLFAVTELGDLSYLLERGEERKTVDKWPHLLLLGLATAVKRLRIFE